MLGPRRREQKSLMNQQVGELVSPSSVGPLVNQGIIKKVAMVRLEETLHCQAHLVHFYHTRSVCTTLPHHLHNPSPTCTDPIKVYNFLGQKKLIHSICITPDKYESIQSKCTTLGPLRIIQSISGQQKLNHSSLYNSKTKEEKGGHIRDSKCFQECIQIHGSNQICWDSVISAWSKEMNKG